MITALSQRQTEIIQATGKILTEEGLSGLTTKRLAQALGFSEAALYRHFPSKESIVAALLQFIGEELESRIALALSDSPGPEESVRRLFEAQTSYFVEFPHFTAAIFSEGLIENSADLQLALSNIMSHKKNMLIHIYQQGQEAGTFLPHPAPAQLAHMTMASVRLLMFQWRMGGFQTDLYSQVQNMLTDFLILIKK